MIRRNLSDVESKGWATSMWMDPYTGPWTDSESAHLGRRAGFGATPAQISLMTGQGMHASVDALVDYAAIDSALEAQIAALPSSGENPGLQDPVTLRELQGYFIYRLTYTTQPLQEQFTLFLHDHFVSEYQKVTSGVSVAVVNGNDGSTGGQLCSIGTLPPDSARKQKIVAKMLLDQLALNRTQGSGPFRAMLRAITPDPAMLIYLDNRLNATGRAQENYAREVMELFSMGVGNYSEEDVREVARAFTGENLDTSCANDFPYTYAYIPILHDSANKTVFTQTFNLAGVGADTNFVIDLILARISNSTVSPAHSIYPAAALYMSWKLITWFVSETIDFDHAAVAELAQFLAGTMAQGDTYNLRETLRTLLKSNLFYDTAFRYRMYKTPPDFMAMALRNLGITETSFTNSARSYMGEMGLSLFGAPNVAGWNHGQAWINSGNLIARYNYANYLSNNARATDAWCDAILSGGALNSATDHSGMIEYFRVRLIQTTLRAEDVTILTDFLNGIESATGGATAKYRRKIRGLIHLFLALPQYQLK